MKLVELIGKKIKLFIAIATIILVFIFISDLIFYSNNKLLPTLPIVLLVFGLFSGKIIGTFITAMNLNYVKSYKPVFAIGIWGLLLFFIILIILQIYNWVIGSEIIPHLFAIPYIIILASYYMYKKLNKQDET